MFEKEAEEYAEKHAFRIPYDGSDKFYDDKDYECSKEGFQKGAEFGYKKATEWHYVKDGDLPSDKHGHVVINQDWDKVTIRNGRFEHLDGCKANVIAWKEIVLPKLPKESE